MNGKRKAIMIVACIFWALVVVSFVVVYILDASVTPLFTDYPFLNIIYGVLIPLSAVCGTLSIAIFIIRQQRIKDLTEENSYRFGITSLFYDRTFFVERVNILKKTHKSNHKEYIVCFAAVNDADNNIYNPYEKKLNSYIASYIATVLCDNPIFSRDDTVFCFYGNYFYIYSFMNLDMTKGLAELIYKEIYNIVNEHELKIFVQPHFGIAEVEDGMIFAEASDLAIAARNYAERNFEDITIYFDELREEASLDELTELSNALKNNEFVVYYQAKFDLKKKKFVGSEALIRWNSPKYGLLSPARFIKKAELGGLIHEIDMYVFKQVIKDLSEIKKSGGRLLPVSMNFSLYEFYSPVFVNDIQNMVKESAIPPELIEIEITETTSQANTFMATSILNKLKDFGFKILMDDFGSGFSNIAHLNALPIDTVKIDKSFIDGLTLDKKNADIVKLLIALCKANGLEVIAEGVDSKEEVSILEKINCDVIQGYYYSEPLPLDKFLKLLEENSFEKKGDKQ